MIVWDESKHWFIYANSRCGTCAEISGNVLAVSTDARKSGHRCVCGDVSLGFA